MRTETFITIVLLNILLTIGVNAQTITTSNLLDELTDLERLIELPAIPYQIVHFTSYDRSSKDKYPDQKGWFNNSDGFGNEPIPNFEEVIETPDKNGIGRYLICDVEGPGAIIRSWTARITGKVVVYMDDMENPLYEGPANPFFINTYDALVKNEKNSYEDSFSQFLSGYFPMPFKKRCRIEWIGNINKLHFYYLQFRKYAPDTKIEAFKIEDIKTNEAKISAIKTILTEPDKNLSIEGESKKIEASTVQQSTSTKIFDLSGNKVIQQITLNIEAKDITKALRQNVLRVVFDDYTWGQIQAPIGDFFGTAPGINPINSLPFTVTDDKQLTCRFIMPFKKTCKIYIDNFSDQDILIEGNVLHKDYQWDDDASMYFHAKWRIDHGLIATERTPKDLVYLMAHGKGRYVGSAAYLMNPTSVPSNWGNWWGEGDEKVFIDNHNFPVVFGTGSEDYYGYAWSSSRLFDYAYIGQPRNDGPGNRGFVTNYRYHIIDDLPFDESLSFFMEIFHHDSVPGFSYGRIAYYYGTPGIFDDHQVISPDDVRQQEMPYAWKPKTHFGSKGFVFLEAEDLITDGKNTSIEEGYLWSNNTLLVWKPEQKGEKLIFNIPAKEESTKAQVTMTIKQSPNSGKLSAKLNNDSVIKNTVDLHEGFHTISRNIRLQISSLKKSNKLELTFEGEKGNEIGIDFFWIKTE